MAFAEQLKRLMESRGLSQAALARELGVYDTNVKRWRSGTGIEIENVRKIADYFGVDREWLERLAGYGDNRPSFTEGTINPEIAAMYDADRAALEDELHGIPSKFWPAIFSAQRTARRLAVELARAALDLAQPQAAISTLRDGQLATLPPPQREHEDGQDESANGPLARRFQLVGAV
jgi:transcriptional regulator with XRE-family HTH domain